MALTAKILDKKFLEFNGVWNTHDALKTISHGHISEYPDKTDSCDISIVKTKDETYFIEDSFADADNFFAFSRSNKDNDVVYLFSNLDECKDVALAIVSERTKIPLKSLQEKYTEFKL